MFFSRGKCQSILFGKCFITTYVMCQMCVNFKKRNLNEEYRIDKGFISIVFVSLKLFLK